MRTGVHFIIIHRRDEKEQGFKQKDL